MLSHNLKIALRNFLKYKVQTLFCVLSLAIGVVTLSVVHSALRNFRLAQICSMPYYDRAYYILFDSIQPRQSQESIQLNADIVRAMKANGGLRCIEQGPYAPNGIQTGGSAEFTYGDGERRKIQLVAMPQDRHYPRYAGVRSAITGEIVRVLRPGEAILSQFQARQIFGKANPVGAKVRLNWEGRNLLLNVVDVYQDLSNNERIIGNNVLFFSPGELEDMDFEYYYALWMDVVLKENATPRQLEAEANALLKPLGLKAKVRNLKESMGEERGHVGAAITIAYLIGSLILVAAIIGFLRMQTQLFWMRRREISLRLTNGATRRQLFSMFATEIALVVALACGAAVAMDTWVYDFIHTRLADHVEELGDITHFIPYTLCISVMVLAMSLAAVWLVLRRICKSSDGLSAGMRRSHSHWFRNVMLGVQIVISTFFLCTTFDFLREAAMMSDFNNIPRHERVYEESLYLETFEADDKQRLRDALVRLPEVGKFIPYGSGFFRITELAENETMCEASWTRGDLSFQGSITHYLTHLTADGAWLDYFGVKVHWKPRANRTKCILVNEELYAKMRQAGVAPGEMLTVEGVDGSDEVLPIAGTFGSIPYQNKDWNGKYSFIVIDPKMRFDCETYILVPKPGEYKALKASVEQTVRRLEPAVVKPMVLNLRATLADAMRGVEIVRGVMSVLAVVSFVICLMSIFSTVMLDTRSRKKEVAIRKVNGALMSDIIKLFGKTYAVIVGVGLVFGVVATLLFHATVMANIGEMVGTVNPALPVVLGVLVIVLFVLAIIVWQVRRIMRIDPSEILAKE